MRTFLLAGILALTLSCSAKVSHPGKSIGIEAHPGVRDLYGFAEAQRAKHGWPALGIGVIHQGKIVGLGMAGERLAGSGNWAALGDRFEVGSIGKSMTATVAAMLVEEGKLRWDTRVTEVFPDWQKSILPAYTNVTLEQLLGHRSGLDRWMSSNPRWTAWHRDHPKETATEKRVLFATTAFQRKPKYTPGTEHFYCNDGYIVAGSLIEKVSTETFEDLMRRRLFEPLEMKSARHGPDPAAKSEEVVWGRNPPSWGRAKSIRPDPAEYGDPPFGSPVGFLYCSVGELLRYVDFHMQGASGKGRLLKRETIERLYTPLKGQQYALGWEVEIKRDSAGKVIERSIYHGGYSGRTRANMWFCPESQWGTVIVCNDGRGDGAEMGAVFFALLKEFGVTE